MFIVPALICIPIGLWGMWFGKDEPGELGWDKPEAIFGEPESKVDTVTTSMSKGAIVWNYVVKNPAIWFLCIANVAAYSVRIGIDNWNVLYTSEALHFSKQTLRLAWSWAVWLARCCGVTSLTAWVVGARLPPQLVWAW